MRPWVPFPWVAFGLAATAAPMACVDETHDAQVQALGGEAPGVPRGPFHRPGQPCVLCHGAAGPATTEFSVAGTVYAIQGQKDPAVGAQVVIEDVNGVFFEITTNAAGNFYVTPRDWSPTYPIHMKVMQDQNSQEMLTNVGRSGSCAACHTDPANATSPGTVYVVGIPRASPEGGP